MGFRRLKNSIRNESTENGEKAALQRELTSLGHRKGPEVTQGRAEDGRTIRLYLWRSTPIGHVCLVSGPDVDAEIHQLSEVETGDEYGSIYFPAKRGRPALSNIKAARPNPSEPPQPFTCTMPGGVVEGYGHYRPTEAPYAASVAQQEEYAYGRAERSHKGFTRPNPSKGPQAKDLAPIGEYYGKPDLFGITAGVPVRFGQILKDLLVTPYDFSDAMAAAVLRYYLKAHGFGKVFSVTTTPGYFNPIQLKQKEMGYIKADGPFGPDFIKAFGFDPPYQYKGFDLRKSTPDSTDLYSDYHDDTPWNVPTESLHYVSALIVSAAAANGLALEPKGAEVLAESKAMKAGKKGKAPASSKGKAKKAPSIGDFSKPWWKNYTASLGMVTTAHPTLPEAWFINSFGDGSGLAVCMDMAELETVPGTTEQTAFLVVVFCDSKPIKEILKAMQFEWSRAVPKGFAKTFEVPPNTWWRVVYETELSDFVYTLIEQIVEIEPLVTFKTPESWLDGIVDKVAAKASYPDQDVITEVPSDPDDSPYVANLKKEAKTFGFTFAKKGGERVPKEDGDFIEWLKPLMNQFTPGIFTKEWRAGWDLVGKTQKPKVTPQVPAMEGMTPLGISGKGPQVEDLEDVKQKVFATIDDLGDAFVEAEKGTKKWLDYDSEKLVDYPLQPDPEANYVVIENALHSAKAGKGLYFTIESGSQKGSNPGGIFYGDDGEKYYAKMFGNPFAGNKQVNTKVFIRALNEVIANQLYRMLGLNAPDQRMLIYLDHNKQFRLLLFAPWQDGYAPFSQSDLIDFDLNKLLSQFPYDAWTANWDVAGMGGDNLLTTMATFGAPHSEAEFPFLRVDQGGALGYRAKGEPKEQSEWKDGGKVAEIETMLDPSVNADSASKFEGTKPSMWADAIEKINKPFWHAPLMDATLAIVQGAMAAEAVSLQQVLLDEAKDVFEHTLNVLKSRAEYLQGYYESAVAEPWKFTGEDSPYASLDAANKAAEVEKHKASILKDAEDFGRDAYAAGISDPSDDTEFKKAVYKVYNDYGWPFENDFSQQNFESTVANEAWQLGFDKAQMEAGKADANKMGEIQALLADKQINTFIGDTDQTRKMLESHPGPSTVDQTVQGWRHNADWKPYLSEDETEQFGFAAARMGLSSTDADEDVTQPKEDPVFMDLYNKYMNIVNEPQAAQYLVEAWKLGNDIAVLQQHEKPTDQDESYEKIAALVAKYAIGDADPLMEHLTNAYGSSKVQKWMDSLTYHKELLETKMEIPDGAIFELGFAAANMGYYSEGKKAPAQDPEMMALYKEATEVFPVNTWLFDAWNFGNHAFALNIEVDLSEGEPDPQDEWWYDEATFLGAPLVVDWDFGLEKPIKLYNLDFIRKHYPGKFTALLESLPVDSALYGLLEAPPKSTSTSGFYSIVGTAFYKGSPKKFEIGYGIESEAGYDTIEYQGKKVLIPTVRKYIKNNDTQMYWYVNPTEAGKAVVAPFFMGMKEDIATPEIPDTPEMDLSEQAQVVEEIEAEATDLLIAPTLWSELTKQGGNSLQWDSFGEKKTGPKWDSMHQDLIETTYKGERWLMARPKTGDKGVLAWFWSMCLYAEVGARAAPARLVTSENGELWIGLKVPEGYSPGTFESLQKFRPNLSAEYPADAWLANWSVFGPKQNMYQNVWVSADGTDYMRVNAQGSLNMRVTGAGKPYPADAIAEMQTLLDPSLAPTAALLFSDAKDDPGIALAMATRIASVSPKHLNTILNWAKAVHVDETAMSLFEAIRARAKVMGREYVPKLLPKGLTGAFGGIAKSIMDEAAAAEAAEAQRQSEAAGALITDGSRVLLVKRSKGSVTSPGYWTIPGGTVDKGETPRKAALREAREELGHVPSPPKMRPAGIEMTATYPPKKGSKKPFTFHTIVFYMEPKTATTYKPFLEDARTPYVEETDGWAWVDLDEIQMYETESGPRVVWLPKLHSGIADPLPFDIGGEEGALVPLLQLWKDSQQEWNEFAQQFQESALAGISAEKLLAEGVPFAYGSGPKPKLKNPSGYVLSGVKTDKQGKTYVEYRPKMPDGSRPRRRVSIESVGLGLEQAATEYRMGRKYKDAKAPDQSVLAAPFAAAVWKWGQGILSSMGAVLTGLFGDDPTEAQLEGMSLLEAAGLPITEATPQIKEVVKIVEKIVEKEVPVEVVKEIITGGPGAAIAADQLGLPLVQVVGKVQFTKAQKATVEDLQDALKEILGDSPNPSTGTASQQKLKSKIQSAIQSTKGPNVNKESSVGKYLRILVEAKKAGLWPDIIDPGRRVVYRGLYIKELSGQKSFSANARTKAQVKAMLDAGITWSGDDLDSVPKWLKAQSKGIDGQSFVRVSDVSPPGYIAVPHSGLVPPGSESEYTKYQTRNNSTSQAKAGIPDWAEKRWANVEGFHIDYRNYSHKGDTVSHWSSKYQMGFGSSSFAIRCRTDLYDGFIMVPTKTLSGTSYGSEYEVICVDMGVDNPIPAQIVKFNISGSAESLTTKQNLAWMGARPPYPKGYTVPSAPDEMAEQSDFVRLQNSPLWKKGGHKSLFSSAGDYIEKVTDAGRTEPPPHGKRSWKPPRPPPLPEKRGAPAPGQPVMTWMVGIPAVGKSTWVAQQLGTNPNSLVIDADLWKEFHPDYDPKNPMRIHRWSRDHVKDQFREVIADPSRESR